MFFRILLFLIGKKQNFKIQHEHIIKQPSLFARFELNSNERIQ